MRRLLAFASFLPLAACGLSGTDNQDEKQVQAGATAVADDNLADSMASSDTAGGPQAIADAEPRPMMQLQVVLDRLGFGPGVIDGKEGMSTTNALKGFQETGGLEETGKFDAATKAALARWSNIAATRVVTVPADWGRVAYAKVPDGAAEQAKMTQLGYESLAERLAERFHTTVEVLAALNPGGRPATQGAAASAALAASPAATPGPTASATPAPLFTAGQQIRVPNIGGDRIEPGAIDDGAWQQTMASLGIGSAQPKLARIVVDKSDKTLRGYDKDDKLVALFTVSSGSSHDPLPLGNWGINGVSHNPPFAYDPDLFWDVPDHEEDRQLPPGPNGPVGVVWIDLAKEHYGIHGTAAPETIGRAQSHGCVRLTNWDAARLAEMVSGATKVVFQA